MHIYIYMQNIEHKWAVCICVDSMYRQPLDGQYMYKLKEHKYRQMDLANGHVRADIRIKQEIYKHANGQGDKHAHGSTSDVCGQRDNMNNDKMMKLEHERFGTTGLCQRKALTHQI